MGKLKIEYSDKKITPFGGMKLLKDFMDKTSVIDDLLLQPIYSDSLPEWFGQF